MMKKFTLIILGVLIVGFVSAQQKINPNLVTAKGSSHEVTIDPTAGLQSRTQITVKILSPDSATSTNAVYNFLTAFTDLTVTVVAWSDIASLTVANINTNQVCFAYNDKTWETAGGTRANVGNVLAQFINGGGKVIECQYLKSFDNWGVAGTYVSGNYSAFGVTSTDTWATTSTMGTVVTPAHPIMVGVTSLEQYFDTQDPTLAAGATEIVKWSDGNTAIAAKPNVVSFNLLPVDPAGTPEIGGNAWVAIHNAIVWMIAQVGIQEETTPDISIFPNPAKDQLHINTNETEGTITIANALGAVVFQQQTTPGMTINTSDFKSGMYFVRIESLKNVSTTKFIVE
jgi:hypothetical protein